MIEILFTPAEFAVLPGRDLGNTTCVVFDVLRATSTMLTALGNGAAGIIPVAEISEALAWRARQPDILLAGERDGLRIRTAQTGSVDFDFGNSPREFTREKVAGRTIAMTTTNGTRALRSCAHAQTVLLGSFLNLCAVAGWIERRRPQRLILICSGTGDQAAYEDTLGVGALGDLVQPMFGGAQTADSARIAIETFRAAQTGLRQSMEFSSNARRLRANPELAPDVEICLRRDTLDLNAALMEDGFVRSVVIA
ncbi:MAG: 2-phosphosulfolactate phosphatase [Pedosphaera sp.]|nr:2-phosphosulfolactate phosphatase [Pedosphaera sp.]